MQKLKELDIVSTPDLLEELMNRCSPAVFIGTKYEGIGENFQNFSNWKGNEATVFGMCFEMAFKIAVETIENKMKE